MAIPDDLLDNNDLELTELTSVSVLSEDDEQLVLIQNGKTAVIPKVYVDYYDNQAHVLYYCSVYKLSWV